MAVPSRIQPTGLADCGNCGLFACANDLLAAALAIMSRAGSLEAKGVAVESDGVRLLKKRPR
jgi:hypothetical protein